MNVRLIFLDQIHPRAALDETRGSQERKREFSAFFGTWKEYSRWSDGPHRVDSYKEERRKAKDVLDV